MGVVPPVPSRAKKTNRCGQWPAPGAHLAKDQDWGHQLAAVPTAPEEDQAGVWVVQEVVAGRVRDWNLRDGVRRRP